VATEPANLIALAFDPSVEPPDDAISERILDAALALGAASGIRNLTMDDVARRARVGRMTVYRRFGDKRSLVEALAVRESRRCLAELDGAAPPGAPIEEQFAEGFVTAMRLAREHPLLNRLASHEPQAVLESLVADGGGIFAAARMFVTIRLRAARAAGVPLPEDVDELAELLVRVGLSFVLIQDTVLPVNDEERLRALARRLVAPVAAAAAPTGPRRRRP
jgi:TetR/AcrR family transcriptional regulator, repressor for uid operon